jgi:hypothetical protein
MALVRPSTRLTRSTPAFQIPALNSSEALQVLGPKVLALLEEIIKASQ